MNNGNERWKRLCSNMRLAVDDDDDDDDVSEAYYPGTLTFDPLTLNVCSVSAVIKHCAKF